MGRKAIRASRCRRGQIRDARAIRKPGARTKYAAKYGIELGHPLARIALDSWVRGHRHAGLWLVDEPLSGAAGPLLLPLDPRRYRIRRVAADGAPACLARRQSDAGLAR